MLILVLLFVFLFESIALILKVLKIGPNNLVVSNVCHFGRPSIHCLEINQKCIFLRKERRAHGVLNIFLRHLLL